MLPALPSDWRTGSVNGLVARGAVEVDMRWAHGKLTEAALRPQWDGALEVRAEGLREIFLDGRPVPMEKTACGWKFRAQAGKEYALRCE